MKSANLVRKETIEIVEKETPKARAGEVVVKVEVCGVSEKDANLFNKVKGYSKTKRNIVLGNQFSGVISEVGKKVKNLQVGDRVSINPYLYCGKCEGTKNNNPNQCTNMINYGVNLDGGFKEYCSVKEECVYKIANKTSFKQAAMAEQVASCINAMDLCNISTGGQVVIVGGNVNGLLMAQLAKLKGASKIALIDDLEQNRNIAKEYGADLVLPNEEAHSMLSERRFDNVLTVIECLGNADSIKTAISVCGNNGTVMLYGVTRPNEQIRIKPFELLKKGITLKTSNVNPKLHKAALDLLDTGRINISKLIDKSIKLENIENVLKNPEQRSRGKVFVTFSNNE